MSALDALCATLGLGDRAAPVLDAVAALYAEVDAAVAAAASPLTLPCRAGCDACCHESVFVSVPEVLYVFAALLAARAPATVRARVAEMTALAERFADELELLETIPPGEERDEVAARVRFRCPLLDADGRCSVYAARELNGRTFGQSWDEARGEAYGCTLTHQRLAILPPERGPQLFGARAARQRLAALFPRESARVHVYPWWFARYGAALVAAAEEG